MAPSDHAKRATTVLTIAQLKFRQAMKNPNNEDRLPPVSAEVSSQLFNSIDAVLRQNTRVNVQKCTEWIVKHIAPSKARIALLGDYLISVSKSIILDQSAPATIKKAARNRMDLLLIVNDVLHTDKFHGRSTMKQGVFGDVCGRFVAELIEQAAACIAEKATEREKKLKAIVNYWAVNQLVSADCLKLCRERADDALIVAQGGTLARKRNYLLPEYHGDRTAPWYDLPASYMLEPMIKYPRRPIDPSRIKVKKLDRKPVSLHVRNLLDNFFENIDLKYRPTGDNPTGETPKYRLSLDPLGQIVKTDKETGETATVANGYGWSMKFCQDMRNHGVPENIKIAREDFKRMEDDAELTPVRSVASHESRRRRSSFLDSDFRRGPQRYSHSRSRSRSRPGSRSSYDSRRSSYRSKSRGAAEDHRTFSPRPMRRGSSDFDQQYERRGPDQSRRPPRQHDRDGPQRESHWDRSDGRNRSAQGSQSNQQRPAPPMPHQNYRQSSFNNPPFPPHPRQFQGQFPMPMPSFGVPPPPPPHSQRTDGFAPPPPPPSNYSGTWPPPPSNMNALPNGPQHDSQYGNNNTGPYNQNQGGYQRGHGYGSSQRGGYSNRGSWRGGGRGGRY